MNLEQVIDLMREAGAGYEHPRPKDYAGVVDVFAKFAALVAAAEREACEAAIQRRIDLQRTGCKTEIEAIRCLAAIKNKETK